MEYMTKIIDMDTMVNDDLVSKHFDLWEHLAWSEQTVRLFDKNDDGTFCLTLCFIWSYSHT